MSAWDPLCMCRCGGALHARGWSCDSCGQRYDAGDGMLRWLDCARRDQLRGFMDQYRRVRDRDGYRVADVDYYRALPIVRPDDPQWEVWSVRRESLERLRQLLLGRFGRGPIRVLDLGAGNGWMSARLAMAGVHPVAVDILDDDLDGLGACRHYTHTFPRVVADFDDLPFSAAQFDAVVFNASLHYAPDTRATLQRAATLLAPGGVLVVADSPLFANDDDGRAMWVRSRARLREQYGIADPIQPGAGFLTFHGLAQVAVALGRDVHFFESHGLRWWSVRRWLARTAARRAAPVFGVWVAT